MPDLSAGPRSLPKVLAVATLGPTHETVAVRTFDTFPTFGPSRVFGDNFAKVVAIARLLEEDFNTTDDLEAF